VSCDRQRLDLSAVHAYLTRSYWSPGIALDTVERAAANSLCFGVFHGIEQVGFCRVITDTATFAYLADVYVLEAHRGKGLSRRLLQAVQAHPDLQHLRRFLLATLDAHDLYRQFGFRPLASPERMMEILEPEAYRRPR
jgi:GNAT superfamily N-acetyltransferase